jgi:hypothetical protein
MSNFSFLLPEWPELYSASTKAKSLAHPDPRAACFSARRGLELAEKLKTAQRASLAELDELFASLQYRAFRGEL